MSLKKFLTVQKNDDNFYKTFYVTRNGFTGMPIKMLTAFYYEGFVQHEFLPGGLTVNKVYYHAVMKSLREAARRKRTIRGGRKVDPTS